MKFNKLTRRGRAPILTAPVKTGNPIIIGTAQVGQTLTATHGTYTGTVTSYSGQWYSGVSAISLATSLSYTIVSGDLGNSITYQESASNAAGSSATGTSNALGPVVASAFTYDNSIGVNPVDSSGFADLPLRSGATRYYVNSSHPSKSDSNAGTDPNLPWATAAKAASKMAVGAVDGTGSQFLFAEGSTYAEGIPTCAFLNGGFSLQYPLVIQSYDPTDPTNEAKLGRANGYGSHARPKFTVMGGSWIFGNMPQQFIALRGLDYDPGDNPNQTLICVNIHDGFLVENCIFRNMDIECNSSPCNHWIFRNTAVYGCYRSGGNAQCFFLSGCESITVEDCVGWHGGWAVSAGTNRGDGTGPYDPTVLSHFCYVQDVADTTAIVRRNLTGDMGADGGSLRSHSVFQDNVGLNNPVHLSCGGVDYDMVKPYNIGLDISYNVFLGTANINSNAPRGYGIDAFNGRADSLAQYNILANGPGSAVMTSTPHGLQVGVWQPDMTQGSSMTYDHNILKSWVTGGNVNNTTFQQSNGSSATITLTATNNTWDKAASGSNINVGTVTFPNAYDENTLAVAAGYADKAALFADATNYPEKRHARTLASLAHAGFGITKQLRDLSWRATWGTGVAESGVIIGAIDGSTLSAPSGLPAGVTLISDSRVLQFDGTPSTASSGNITIRETASDGSTHDTTLSYNIVLLPILTSGGATVPTSGGATIKVNTTGTDGTIYWLVTPTDITKYDIIYPAQVAKHLFADNSRTNLAGAYGNTPCTGAGTYTFNPTGLTNGTAYNIYFSQKMAGGLYSKSYFAGTVTPS